MQKEEVVELEPMAVRKPTAAKLLEVSEGTREGKSAPLAIPRLLE